MKNISQLGLDTFIETVYYLQYMKTYDLSDMAKKLSNSVTGLVDKKSLSLILGVNGERNLYLVISKLIASGWLVKIERNSYKINNRVLHDFEIANFVYQPSYVSFETALNYWGILSQFPFEITSATLKNSKIKTIDDKIFGYSRINKKYYSGFVKVDNFLIASPEKALFDQIYLWSKGLKQLSWDEYDLTRIDKVVVKKMLLGLSLNKKFKKYIGKGGF